MKLTTILLSLTIALSTTALHAAPTAKQILELHGAGDTSCGDDERGTVSELRLLSAAEAKKITGGQMETTPKSKYLMVIGTLSPAAAENFGEPTSWYMQEVDANAKLEEFKPLIGTASCHMLGD